jgi:hypothetical protein
MGEGFEGREIDQVLLTNFLPIRNPNESERFGGIVSISVKAIDGTSQGPNVTVQIGVVAQLDKTPFQELEVALIERALLLIRHIGEHSPAELHARWIEICHSPPQSTSPISVTIETP